MSSERLTVRDLISRQDKGGLFWVGPDDSLEEAARTMQAYDVSAIVVLDEDQLAGIVSEKDVSHVVAGGGHPASTLVEEVMATDLVTVDINTSLWTTASYMLKHNVRHLPVLDQGRPYSTISMRDVLSLLVERLESENERLRADLGWVETMQQQHGT